MENLRVTTVQADLVWEDKVANLKRFDEKLEGLAGNTDLIILPEMFTTGFTMRTHSLAESMDGPSLTWLKEKAKSLNAAIMGSLIIGENNDFYNRLIYVTPSGDIQQYDKRHLFTMGDEHDHFTPGEEKLIIELHGWRICPLICYDLRFPVWARNVEDYDLLIYTANWPEPRNYAWKSLLLARAIENQCYTVGVNRVGKDGKGLNYSGDTCVIGPMGDKPIYIDSNEEAVRTTSISKVVLHEVRSKLPFLADRDEVVIIRDVN
ncbi:MAG: amidohydrolase [Bacteroidota bacterium]